MNELTSVQDKREAKAEAESQAEVDRFMFRHGLVPLSATSDPEPTEDTTPDPEPTHEATTEEPEQKPTPESEPKEKPVMSDDTKVVIDDVGNFIDMDQAKHYPARPPEIEGCETPEATVLVATRLGRFFLLKKDTGANGRGYTPMTDRSVESFCLANGYSLDIVMAVESTEVLQEISMHTGEL